MIIRNKHKSQEIGVTDKSNVVVYLKPGEQVEVDDAQGRGYMANYSHILEKLDVPNLTTDEKEVAMANMKEQIKTLTSLVEKLTKVGGVENLSEDELAVVEKADADETEDNEEKIALMDELKLAKVK